MTTPGGKRLMRWRLGVACAAGVLIAAGCKKSAESDKPQAEAVKPAVQTVDRGPVKLTVTANKSQISIAERLELTVEVQADADIDVKLPQFGESLAAFQIRGFEEPPVRTDDAGRRTFTQKYDLDIFLSGEYAIPGITARYRKEGPPPEGEEPTYAELTTDPLKITVTSLLEGEFDPQAFHDVKAVAELPVEWDWKRVTLVSAGGVVALGVLAFLGVWGVRRMLRPQAMVAVPPDEWALDHLRRLADEHLIEEGHIQEFYYRLSEIARRYIELRFGLMAPERTTEEFLLEMRGDQTLSREQQALLGEFLEACDLVKYALHQPDTRDIEQVFNAARDFVMQTRSATPRTEEVAA